MATSFCDYARKTAVRLIATALATLVTTSCTPLPSPIPDAAMPIGYPAENATQEFLLFLTGLPPEKQTAEVAVALTNQALVAETTPASPPILATYTAAPFQSGIFPNSTGPMVPTFASSSQWQGMIQGEDVVVYAGAKKDPTLATPILPIGAVYVVVRSVALQLRHEAEYDAPGETGALTVIAEDHLRLTLSGDRGVIVFFDVPSRKFVDTLDSVAPGPTVTPLMPVSSDTVPTGYPGQLVGTSSP